MIINNQLKPMWKLLYLTDDIYGELFEIIEAHEEERNSDQSDLREALYQDAFRDIVKEIHEHEEYINSKDDDGDYEFDSYLRCTWKEFDTPLEAVENADIDSEDFNIWFEQWYLRGMEVISNLFSNNNTNG